MASTGALVPLLVTFFVRNRAALRPDLVPWRLLVFVTGLFLVVQTLDHHGLGAVVGELMGSDDGHRGAFRAAATGAAMSNLVNNLPAYVAGEAVVAPVDHDRLLALLLGTNIGPLVTPWASLATLLWYERCTAHGVRIDVRRFMATGAALAATGLIAAVGALLAS